VKFVSVEQYGCIQHVLILTDVVWCGFCCAQLLPPPPAKGKDA
jgi:hypothetical protein